MALDFPNAPTNGQVYTVTGTGEQWVYEAVTNSWTSKGLVNTTGGLQYKGDVNITAAPPAGATSGSQYSVNPGGTANAGFGPGVTGTVAKGSMVMYTGTGWVETSHVVPDATPAVKGIDTRKWDRTGTVLSPATAGDVVNISAGTAALPGLAVVGDAGTGLSSPGPGQLAISTGGTGRLFVDSFGRVTVTAGAGPGISTSSSIQLTGAGSSVISTSDASGLYLDSTAAELWLQANADIVLRGSAPSYGERLRVTSAGLVGVGTSVPQGLIDARTDQAAATRVVCNNASFATGASTNFDYYLGTKRLGGLVHGFDPNSYFGIDTWNGSAATRRLTIDSAGRLGVGTTTAGATLDVKAAAATTPLIVQGPSSEFLRCDQQGRLLVGTSSARGVATQAWGTQFEGTDYANSGLSLAINRNDFDCTYLVFGKSRGTAAGSATTVQANDNLGGILFAGADGSSLNSQAAAIRCQVDGTPGANDMPGRIVLSTTAAGASSPTPRMTIKNNGTINFSSVAVYADNAAATTGGLAVGDVYRTSTGQLMIRY